MYYVCLTDTVIYKEYLIAYHWNTFDNILKILITSRLHGFHHLTRTGNMLYMISGLRICYVHCIMSVVRVSKYCKIQVFDNYLSENFVSSASFTVYSNNLPLAGISTIESVTLKESMSLCEKLTAYYNILHHKSINVTYIRPSIVCKFLIFCHPPT